MTSDAMVKFLDTVTKHFFSCCKIVFLATRTIFLLQERECCTKEKYLAARKKCIVTLSRRICLAPEKISVSVCFL